MIGKFLVAVFLGFCKRMNDAYRYLMDKIIIVVREKKYFYRVVKLLKSRHINELLLFLLLQISYFYIKENVRRIFFFFFHYDMNVFAFSFSSFRIFLF